MLTETQDGMEWALGDALPSRGELHSASSRNKAATNATNLFRVNDLGHLSEVVTSASFPVTQRLGGFGRQSLPSTRDYSAKEKYFSDQDCVQMKRETLTMYGFPTHMNELIEYSDMRSPVFISLP